MSNQQWFETIKIQNGTIYHLAYHQQRFQNTSGLDIELQAFLYPPKDGLYRCKLIYDTNRISEVIYYKYKKREIKSFRLIPIDFEYSTKALNRSAIDRTFEQRGNNDEVIMIKDNKITDTSIANIAFYDGSNWFTPKEPLLAGTTRARYIEQKKIIPKTITPSMLENFSHIALMNAMIDFDIMSIKNLSEDTIVVN